MLSRKRQTITGNHVIKSLKTIKPSKTRKIIRQFHLLIAKRKVLVKKLHLKDIKDNDEEGNIDRIKKQLKNPELISYEKGSNSDKSTEFEKSLLKLKNITERNELIELLGYIMNEIVNKGGLTNYQLASRMGQENNRGGDSSKLLIKWLQDDLKIEPIERTLEIGSLSSKNYISKSKIIKTIERIDLQNINNDNDIIKQDFMERPIAKTDDEKFNLISCSLVLNFVNTPLDRGLMCLRFDKFLKQDGYLFIVLPLPCLKNSRYMNTDLFKELMNILGYTLLIHSETHKISYMLFQKNKPTTNHNKFTKKIKLHDKPGMNNFSIILPSHPNH